MKTVIENENNVLKEVSERLLSELKKKGIKEDVIFDIHVGFEESLRNAMIHGNKLDPGKKVTIETEITDNSIIIKVEDEGEGFDPSSLPDPTLDKNLLKESGRGVYLIKHLMDLVEYENKGRRVVMTKFF
ncbi:MAG: ATP-binding protein [Candidatus Omnitrophica bacterium]|nr:ATP-binding protein [Candidatus Omnitrophota bacterium]